MRGKTGRGKSIEGGRKRDVKGIYMIKNRIGKKGERKVTEVQRNRCQAIEVRGSLRVRWER